MQITSISSPYSLSPPLLNYRKAPPGQQLSSRSLFSRRKEAWRWTQQTAIFKVSSSENQTAKEVIRTPSRSHDDAELPASEIVRRFYEGINDHDLASIEDLIAQNCVYEDLVFPRPFVGHKSIMDFFKKFTDSSSKDLQFVIEDISAEDSLAVGVTWHLEWRGKPFPFSKGCSFYRLAVFNSKKQIIYGRDSVEPAIKPGEATLVIIRFVAWLFQRFPQLADQLK